MYKALYRAYRPATFEQIVGQQHIVTTLKNTIAGQKIGHAYLFHGPRGTGKTTIAKIFAAAVNCQASIDSVRPCHACQHCQLIDNGESSDIIELDAASNSGVDEIRQIREFVRYAPTHLPYKVYIIDEVHMLSTAAFNALLKTLEEPPAHVIFILATTESHKIPATIISRCQRFDFKKVSIAHMKQGLIPIIEQENIAMSEAALDYLVDYADGGMRDALSVLDQVRMYTTAQVEVQDLHDVIGSVGPDVYLALIQAVTTQDVQTMMTLLADVITSGKNVQLFVEGFLRYLLREVEANLQLQDNATDDVQALLDMLEKMNQLAGGMRTAFSPQVALQAGFLELTYSTQNSTQNSTQKRAEIGEDKLAPLTGQRAASVPVINKSDITDEQKTQADARVSSLCADDGKVIRLDNDDEKHNKGVTAIDATTTDVLDLYDADNFTPPIDEPPTSDYVVDEPVLSRLSDYRSPELASRVSAMQSEKEEDIVHERLAHVMEQGIAKMQAPGTSVVPTMTQVASSVNAEEASSIHVAEDDGKVAMVDEQGGARKRQIKDDEQRQLVSKKQQREALLLTQAMVQVVLEPTSNALETIKRHWQTLKFDPNNQVVVMLLDMELKIATHETIVLSSANEALTNQLQMERNKREAEVFLSALVGADYRVVVIDEATWIRTREQFSRDWKANQVTKETLGTLAHDIHAIEAELATTVRLEGDELSGTSPSGAQKEEAEPIVKAAIDLFGSDIVEVK